MRIFSNLSYKVLAIVIALFLWLVARGSSSVERGFDIPVVLQGVPDDLVVVDQGADVVNVRLLGTRSALRNFNPERLEYPLEISEAKPGQADFEVDLSRFDLPRGARVVSRSPSRIELSLERRIGKTVKVKPDLEGQPAEGFRVAEIAIDPPRVRIAGARSEVLRLSEVATETIDMHLRGTRSCLGRVAADREGQGGGRSRARRSQSGRATRTELRLRRRGEQMARELFGTDGVRGRANVDPMTAEMALTLGQAVSVMFRRRGGERHKIIIGKDTRRSGYMFENALVAGICSMGVDVLQVGPMPTPGMAFLTADMRCDAGVMISASHNPFTDNGIKFFSHDGFKLPDEFEQRIEELISNGKLASLRAPAEDVGRAQRIEDATGRYVV
ncbi:MAG: hypothetical protein NTZ61_14810, partial [Proteobacteria bacterium]|nr:hypothetical protein [Pseudomonadota bacterium]